MGKIRLLVFLVILPGIMAQAQKTPRNTEILAYFEDTKVLVDERDRLAELFETGLEQKYDKGQLTVKFCGDDDKYLNGWINTSTAGYLASVQLLNNGWQVERSFKVPFTFFIYRNNYTLEAFVRVYSRSKHDPVLKKTYKIKIGGPRVYQFFDKNPHDGGLFVTYGERLEKQKEAEQKLMASFVDDMISVLKKYEDR